jgi:hypothetical protein
MTPKKEGRPVGALCFEAGRDQAYFGSAPSTPCT